MQFPDWDKSLIDKCKTANILYLSMCSALELSTLRAHGQSAAATLMFKMLRRHQLEHFLPGLKKLGIDKDPSDAVKSAKYHYFSNILGGLEVEFMEETPEKAWVRYPPPFAMSDSPFTPSAAVAAYAPEVGHAVFRAWHAHNGVSLGNPRLGFVMTQVAHQGDPCLEGYFKIFDRDLEPDERLQFSPAERGPAFDPSIAHQTPRRGVDRGPCRPSPSQLRRRIRHQPRKRPHGNVRHQRGPTHRGARKPGDLCPAVPQAHR